MAQAVALQVANKRTVGVGCLASKRLRESLRCNGHLARAARERFCAAAFAVGDTAYAGGASRSLARLLASCCAAGSSVVSLNDWVTVQQLVMLFG